MGFLSGITDTLFGDGGEEAANKQAQQNESDRKFIAQQTDVARSQAMPLMAASEANKLLGQQAAIDALYSAAPQQIGAFQQGGQNAMAAILGGDINPIQYSTDHLNVQLPQFHTMQDALGSGFQSQAGSVFQPMNPEQAYSGMTNAQILAGAGGMQGLSQGAKDWLPKWGQGMALEDPALSASFGYTEDPLGHLAAAQQSGLTNQNKRYVSELMNILSGA